jgi:site-specific DNA recombinase
MAAIYARVSTEDQGRGFSLPTQIEACQILAQQAGYIIPESHVLRDDMSGTTLDRPGLRQLRKLVTSRAIAAVIVHDPDRLSRTLGHQLLLSEELEQAGVRLLIVSHPLEKGPEGWLFFQMRGAIAEYERAKILERLKRGHLGRAKAGHPEGGTVPLGYRYIKGHKQGHYEIDAEEAGLVRRIFQMCLDGRNTTTIAKQLSAERIPTHQERRGHRHKKLAPGIWSKGSVHHILRNEVYIGRMYYNKFQRVPGIQDPTRRTRAIQRDPSEWQMIPVPALIDEATFEAVQAQLQRNAELGQRRRKYEYLFLAGRLRCGRCGGAMSGFNTPRGQRRYRCLRPRWQIAETDIPFCRGGVNADMLESQVWTTVEDVFNDPERIAAEIVRQHENVDARHLGLERETQLLTTALARCDRELKRWEEAYLGEAITLEDFKAKKAEVDARRDSLLAERSRLEEQARQLEHQRVAVTSLVDYCRLVRANLATFDIHDKRKALEALSIVVAWEPGAPPQIQGSIPMDATAVPVYTTSLEL